MRISDWSSDVCSSDLANPYVALLGPEKTSHSRLTLAQSMNSLGTTVAPLFGGLLILAAAPRTASELAAMPAAEAIAYRAQEAQSVQGPYLGLAVTLFVLAVVVMAFRDRKSNRLNSSH